MHWVNGQQLRQEATGTARHRGRDLVPALLDFCEQLRNGVLVEGEATAE